MDAAETIIDLYGGIPKTGEATPTNQGLHVTIAVADGAPGPKVVSQDEPATDQPATGQGLAVQIQVGTGRP